MTYNVFSGTLNPTHSLTRPTQSLLLLLYLLFAVDCCIIIIFYPRQSLFSEHTCIQHVTKVIPQSRTGSRETPIAEFVVSSWDEQLPDVIRHGGSTVRASGLVDWLEFNVPFQRKYGYIRDEVGRRDFESICVL